MIVTVDIGNTNINVAFCSGRRITAAPPISSNLPAAVIGRQLSRILKCVSRSRLEAVVVCSVVPPVSRTVERITRRMFGKPAVFLGRDLTIPIKNRYGNPRQVGQDRLACAFAAVEFYGAPAIVIDLGTAITVDVVSRQREYLGGIIIPGLRLSAESLFRKTALLPMVDIRSPKALIGKDTQSSILSGLFYGYGQMLQGLIVLIKKKVSGRPKVIITGGYAALMQKYLHPRADILDEALVAKGIFLAWQRRVFP